MLHHRHEQREELKNRTGSYAAELMLRVFLPGTALPPVAWVT
ncbi:hypothetical protein [Streptomyces sp. NPDC051554]